MKNQEFRGHWLALLLCFLLLSGQGASAAEINLADYEVYTADLNDNGYPDFYFFGKPRVLVLHGDLSLPVVYAQADSFVIYQNSAGYGQAVPLTLNRAQMAAAGLTLSENSDVFHQSILDSSSSSASSSSQASSVASSSSAQTSSVVSSSSSSSVQASSASSISSSAPGTIPAPAAPSLALPGGANIGFDSTEILPGEFNVTPSGQATYSIPIITAPAPGNFVPQISLNYSSGAGNGALGQGWSIGGLGAITRCRQTEGQDKNAAQLTWTAEDRFCLNGERLLVNSGPYGGEGSTYRTETDRYIRVTTQGIAFLGYPESFEVEYKNGIVEVYGANDAKHNVDILVEEKTYSWLLSERRDSAGNSIEFDYHVPNAHHHSATPRIREIRYAYAGNGSARARLNFDWELRSDKIQGYIAGFPSISEYRLREITSWHDGQQLRRYGLQYMGEQGFGLAYNDELSRLGQIDHCVGAVCGQPTFFEWPFSNGLGFSGAASTHVGLEYSSISNPSYVLADLNGDGLPDVVWIGANRIRTALASLDSSGRVTYQDRSVVGGEIVVAPDAKIFVMDYNGDGRQDIAVQSPGYSSHPGFHVYLSRAQSDGTWALNAGSRISLNNHDPNGTLFVDVNGDGLVDIINLWTKKVHFQNPDSTGEYLSGQAIVFTHAQQQNPCSNLTVGDLAHFSATGDFNGDGRIDFIVGVGCPSGEHGPQYHVYTSHPTASGGLELRFFDVLTQFPLSENAVKVADFNNDGLSDVIYEGVGAFRYRLSNGVRLEPARNAPYPSDWQHLSLADVNGDGYVDLVGLDGNPAPQNMRLNVHYWDQQIQDFRTTATRTAMPFNGLPDRVEMRDTNGNGLPDLVAGVFPQGPSNVNLWILQQDGKSAERHITAIRRTGNAHVDIQVRYDRLGQSPHYSYPNKVASSLYEEVCQETAVGHACWDRMTAALHWGAFVPNPEGSGPFSPSLMPAGSQVIESPLIHRVFNVASTMPVVTEVSRRIPVGDPNNPRNVSDTLVPVSSYYYEQGRMQSAGRGFLGFKKVTEVNRQNGSRKVTEYRQDWPFTGKPFRTALYSAEGSVLNETENAWGLVNCGQNCLNTMRDNIRSGGTAQAAPIRPYMNRSESWEYGLESHGGQGTLLGRKLVTREMDNHGNIREEDEYTYDGAGQQVLAKTTFNDFYYTGSTYSMQKGRLMRMEVGHVNAQGYIGRTSEFTYYTSGPMKGLVKEEIIEPENNNYKVVTTHSYDNFGNRTQSNVTAGGVTRFGERVEYDETGRFPVKVYGYRTAGSETTQTEYLKTHVLSYDKFGTPTEIRHYVSASNYVTQRVATTPFGTPYFRSDSTGGRTLITAGASHASCPGSYRYQEAAGQGGTTSLTCFDARNRVIRQGQRMLDNSWSVVDTEYDVHDRVLRVSEPYYLSGGTAHWARNHYDVLGRVIQIDHAGNNGSTNIEYEGHKKTVTNPLGNTQEEFKNPLGQIISTKGALPGADITYVYDARGNLKSMTGPGGTTTIQYDLLDRKTSMNDPDKGTWHYAYNRFGELTCQTDAKGQRIVQSYDRRGRLFNRRDAKGGTCASPSDIESNTTWTYDTAANGFGQLSLVKDTISGYEQQTSYDSFGRAQQTRTRLPGVNDQLQDHYERVTYDQFGRVFQIFDAARNGATFNDNAVQHIYQNGYLQRLVDAVHINGATRDTYYRADKMDARGNVTEAKHGTDMTRFAAYDPATGRLSGLVADNGFSLGGPLQDLALTWDHAGNLKSRTETGIGSGWNRRNLTESYDYDAMNRLTKWTSSGVFTGVEEYQYNSRDNMTFKTGIGSYLYGNQCNASRNAGPHAVCKAGSTHYNYDNNGNMISDDTGRALTYSVFDMPVEIKKGTAHTTRFAYGPDRARYKRTDTQNGETTTTLYLGNVEKIHYPNGTVQWKRDIGGVAIITQELNSGGGLFDTYANYLIHDHLGTLSLITDDGGMVYHELYSDPWGQPRKPQWNPQSSSYKAVLNQPFLKLSTTVTTRGFTGHEHLDEVGIIHMNGRIYDPALARFLQADPIVQDPTSTRSLNRYSYVWNNPLNATDPSGFVREEDDARNKEEEEQRKDQRKADEEKKRERAAREDLSGVDTGTPDGTSENAKGSDGSKSKDKPSLWERIYPFSDHRAREWGNQTGISKHAGTPGGFSNEEKTIIGLLVGGGGAFPGKMPVSTPKAVPQSSAGAASRGADRAPPIKPGAADGPTAGQAFPKRVKDAAKAENPTATCVYCRREGTGTQVDHSISRARGGDATLENAQLACPHCNASKGAGDFPKTPPSDYVGPWPPGHW